MEGRAYEVVGKVDGKAYRFGPGGLTRSEALMRGAKDVQVAGAVEVTVYTVLNAKGIPKWGR